MLFRPSVDSKYGTCGAATDLFHLGDPNVGDSFGRQPGLDRPQSTPESTSSVTHRTVQAYELNCNASALIDSMTGPCLHGNACSQQPRSSMAGRESMRSACARFNGLPG